MIGHVLAIVSAKSAYRGMGGNCPSFSERNLKLGGIFVHLE